MRRFKRDRRGRSSSDGQHDVVRHVAGRREDVEADLLENRATWDRVHAAKRFQWQWPGMIVTIAWFEMPLPVAMDSPPRNEPRTRGIPPRLSCAPRRVDQVRSIDPWRQAWRLGLSIARHPVQRSTPLSTDRQPRHGERRPALRHRACLPLVHEPTSSRASSRQAGHGRDLPVGVLRRSGASLFLCWPRALPGRAEGAGGDSRRVPRHLRRVLAGSDPPAVLPRSGGPGGGTAVTKRRILLAAMTLLALAMVSLMTR